MWKAFAALAAIALVLLGCSSSGGRSDVLTGAGATFPYPLYTRWIAEYRKQVPAIAINYQSIGSGGGIRQLTQRTVDFGASDAPMTDEQLAKVANVVHIPTCAGAVVLAYNIQGVGPGLKLTPDAIAGIFLGEIKQWDDPKIKAHNPSLSLPAKPIASVHRSDGSGTTKIFLDYLSKVSPAWASGPGTGTSVSWPTGLGAKGNEGVAGQIETQPNSIGYIELSYAAQNGMATASIQNRAGNFVAPTIESTTAAARGALAAMPADLRVSIVDPEGEDAYPIAGFTYVLLRGKQTDPVKGRALVAFLDWALTDGQKLAAPLHYAPLPPEVVEKARARLAGVTGPTGEALE